MKKLFFTLLILLTGSFIINAQTVIYPNAQDLSGNWYYQIAVNETWNYDTAYVVTCDIRVESGATFTITPVQNLNKGVNIYFYPFTFLRIDNGILSSVGSVNKMINFTSSVKYSTLQWKGICFHNTPNNLHSEIKYSIVEYVEKFGTICGPDKNSDGAIFLNEFNNITIENCIIRNNSVGKRGGGIFVAANNTFTTGPLSGYPKILSNQIINNNAKIGGGICVFYQHGYAFIEKNTIENNIAYQDGGGIAVINNSHSDIIGNTIIGNTSNGNVTINPPDVTGGGGIIIGLKSNATIISNIIQANEAIRNTNYTDPTGIGGGILIRMQSEAFLQNNTITQNFAYNGAGLAEYSESQSWSPNFISCINNEFSYNQSSNDGGGIYIHYNAGDFIGNTIFSNESVKGGGIFVNSSTYNKFNALINTIDISLNKVYNNYSVFGAGLWCQGEYSQTNQQLTKINIYNNAIYSNQSFEKSPGIYLDSYLDLNFNNNTITKNYSKGYLNEGYGLFINDYSTNNQLSFVNNIFSQNSTSPSDRQIYHTYAQSSEYKYNNIPNWPFSFAMNTNNDFGDPFYTDYFNDDFTLLSNSPLINIGDNSVIPVANTDLSGFNRFEMTIDIGAYEHQAFQPRLQQQNDNIAIFPNPANDIVTVKTNSPVQNIEVLSLDGKIVYNLNCYGKDYFTLDLNNLNSGIYILKLRTNNSTIFQKLNKL